MSGLENIIQNSGLSLSQVKGASQGVLNAIHSASASVGVDFSYLVEQAAAESNFRPDVKAKSSSATGLFQFIESTWLNMVEDFGEKHGLETDGKSRRDILELRKDPETASLMAAELANQNQSVLESRWAKGEKDIGSTELYFAHFMGAGGASSFLNARDENPLQEAAVLFPKAAKANPNVFYDRATGQARSLEDVYAFFDKKFTDSDVTQIAVSEPSLAEQAEELSDAEITELAQSIQISDNAAPAQSVIFQNNPAPRHVPADFSHLALSLLSKSSPIPSSDAGGIAGLLSNPVEMMFLAQLDFDLPFNSDRK